MRTPCGLFAEVPRPSIAVYRPHHTCRKGRTSERLGQLAAGTLDLQQAEVRQDCCGQRRNHSARGGCRKSQSATVTGLESVSKVRGHTYRAVPSADLHAVSANISR